MMGMNKSKQQKGDMDLSSILMVMVIAVGIYFTIQYFKNRNNDIVIHVPKVEVH